MFILTRNAGKLPVIDSRQIGPDWRSPPWNLALL